MLARGGGGAAVGWHRNGNGDGEGAHGEIRREGRLERARGSEILTEAEQGGVWAGGRARL